MTTKLSVNVNKLATLRNSRGGNTPDVLKTTLDIISYGAQGITVHPRPDERHIRRTDVYDIAKNIAVEFNVEGYPSKEYLDLVLDVKPAQCTLVPDPPEVLTSNAGWLIEPNLEFLTDVISKLHANNIRVSLFVDPHTLSAQDIRLLAQTKTDRVELYTESYATHYGTSKGDEILYLFKNTAQAIYDLGIDLNAGHDLNLLNLRTLIQEIPMIKEVSIGHALICDALYYGLKDTIARYLDSLN
ncbi:MAG: pyridoxine 5'-phosphate synthase [Legionellales bacterium]|jgi:pyridoxine 5-phosphate synthase